MNILGLSAFRHESSAALLKDGRICALVEEERLNREKHTWKFPSQSIARCLEIGGISFDQIDQVTFYLDPFLEISGNVGHMFRFFPRSLGLLSSPTDEQGSTNLSCLMSMAACGRRLADLYAKRRPIKLHYIEHHLAHAASAFYPSLFDEAAILTMDGRGEAASTVMCLGRGNSITKLAEIKVPHSLGHLYSTITDHLGFRPFFDEWKVMGMSAYGKDSYAPVFKDMVHLLEDGTYRLNLDYFTFHLQGRKQWAGKRLTGALGPRRNPEGEYEQRHFDIACSLQKAVEAAGVHLARGLHRRTRSSRLCLTGGVALNCLMNKRIMEEAPFKEFFIQPIANDAGTSLGSALYLHHHLLGAKERFPFDNIYLGPEFSNKNIEDALKVKGVRYEKSSDIARAAAGHIAQGKIVGWFQGRMEAGPRALGNRSILADPRNPAMKDRLNRRVKKREFFRPFAPSVQEERAGEYFKMPKDQRSPHMILAGEVHPQMRGIIPAVTHIDGTARVHTVSKESNLKYWHLINAMGKITGVPIVLNTSFNENEPIVCTPEDAIDCFLRTDLDVLAIGDFLILSKRLQRPGEIN